MKIRESTSGQAYILSVVLFAAAMLFLVSGCSEPEEEASAENTAPSEEAVESERAAAGDEDKPYTVVDGAVDKGTFNGYRRYHADCHVCHGPDGMGSSYAPALVDSLKTLTEEDFFEVTLNGRDAVSATSSNVMPAFATDPNVAGHLGDIYSYLKARSDGALGRGRPPKIGQKRLN